MILSDGFDTDRFQKNVSSFRSYVNYFSQGDVVLARLLVKGGLPSTDANLVVRHFTLVEDVAPAVFKVNLSNFEVIGVALVAPGPGVPIRNASGDYFATDSVNDWIVDLVVRVMSSDAVASMGAGDIEIQASTALSQRWNDGQTAEVHLLAYDNIARGADSDVQSFWKNDSIRPMVRVTSTATVVNQWYTSAKRENRTVGPQVAFGLADFPSLLTPVAGKKSITSTDDGNQPNTGYKPPVSSSAKLSATTMLTFGAFAVVGYFAGKKLVDW